MLGRDTLTSGLCHVVVDKDDGLDTEVLHGGAGEQYSDQRQDLMFREKKSKSSSPGVLPSRVSGIATSAFHSAICFPLY